MKIRMPNIKRVCIRDIPSSLSVVNDFFAHSFPLKVDLLYLHISLKDRESTEYYLDNILECLPRVRAEIWLNQFDFKNNDLARTLKQSRDCQRLVLEFGNFPFDQEFDFSGTEYKLPFLSFFGAAYNNDFNHWDEYPERFERIIRGISNCGLKDSLVKLDVSITNVTKDQAQEMLDSYGLRSITAVEEVKWPLKN
jgi:hypothetical protein